MAAAALPRSPSPRLLVARARTRAQVQVRARARALVQLPLRARRQALPLVVVGAALRSGVSVVARAGTVLRAVPRAAARLPMHGTPSASRHMKMPTWRPHLTLWQRYASTG